MTGNLQINVTVDEKEVKTLEDYLKNIPADYNEVSFYEKRSTLNQLIHLTHVIIQDRGKAFEQASELVNENQKVIVLLIDRIEALIKKSFDIQKLIMESYMNPTAGITIKREI